MSETLLVQGKERFDKRGNLIMDSTGYEIPGCVVGLQGQADIDGAGVWDGDATTLEVFAPPGTVVEEGALVVCRGVEYQVTNVPFDWSYGRRPWNQMHRPRVRFLIERKEA